MISITPTATPASTLSVTLVATYLSPRRGDPLALLVVVALVTFWTILARL